MTAPQFDYSNIPPELQARRQWVLWGVDPDNPKAPRQVVSPTQGAKANNPMTWGSFEPARCIVDMIGDARMVLWRSILTIALMQTGTCCRRSMNG